MNTNFDPSAILEQFFGGGIFRKAGFYCIFDGNGSPSFAELLFFETVWWFLLPVFNII